MPTFPRDLTSPGIDWFLIRDRVVTLFWRERLLDDALEELRAMGYKVVDVDAAGSADDQAFLVAIGTALDFPDYYGKNLDALNDCLRDVATFDYGSDLNSTGTVVAFRHYDRIVATDAKRAEAVLDIFTDRARDGLLIGHRMMVLVQSDDPELSFGPLGGQSAGWNQNEWMNITRHPDREPRNAMEASALRRVAALDGADGASPTEG
jgi:RNAse (barnase) inhibitor barstar